MSAAAEHCAAARALLLGEREREGTGVFVLAFEDCIEIDAAAFPDPQVRAAVLHVHGCPACRAWRCEVFAPVDRARLARAGQYCCHALFRAADDADPPLRIDVERLGPEMLVYWMAGPAQAVIDFCPWCGSRLPCDRVPETARARH